MEKKIFTTMEGASQTYDTPSFVLSVYTICYFTYFLPFLITKPL